MIANQNRVGFWLAVLTALLTAISFSIAIFGSPSYKFSYPYTPEFIAVDYAWLIPAIILMPTFVALMVFIHYYGPNEKKIFSQIALSFAIVCAVLLMADYFVQWTVVLPSITSKETVGLSLFTQYNPHGFFVGLESLGYLMMNLALLFLAPVFGDGRLQKSLRWLFVASFVLAVGSFIGITAAGYDVVRFEVVIITTDWIVLIVSGILLSVLFKRLAKMPQG